MPKNRLIIFSGPYPIDKLGATRTIDIPLAKSMRDLGYNVTLIASGKCYIKGVCFIEIKNNKFVYLFYRIMNKLGLKFNFQIIKSKIVDKKVSNILKKQKK